jgi:hypothetical protein
LHCCRSSHEKLVLEKLVSPDNIRGTCSSFTLKIKPWKGGRQNWSKWRLVANTARWQQQSLDLYRIVYIAPYYII